MSLTPEELQIDARIEKHVSPMPFYVKEYIRDKKRAGRSPDTLLQYLYRFTHFFNWLVTDNIVASKSVDTVELEELEKLSKSDVQLYIDFLREQELSSVNANKKKRGNSVVNLSISALKSLFNYLTTETEIEEEGPDKGECYFHRNVMKKIKIRTTTETANKRAQKISSVILNENEITEFLDFVNHKYLDTLPNKINQQRFLRDKERDLAILSLMLGSGIRVSEAAKLHVKKIRPKRLEIEVIRKGNKEDVVSVLENAMDDLKAYLDIRETRYPCAKESPFCFVSVYGGNVRPLSRRAIQNLVNKYTAAFSEGEGMSPHKLRHSFSSDYIRKGGNIVLLMGQLGHESIETTSLYTNLAKSDNEKVMRLINSSRLENRKESQTEN